MNLYKIYHDICNRGHDRGTKKTKGFELHHIIPACYFKSRKIATYNENLCLLTPKEHYVVHHCLSKFGDIKMINAFWLMSNTREFKLTCNEYEKLRIYLIKINSGKTYRKGKSLSVESKNKISNALKGKEPWNKGKKCPHKGISHTLESKIKISLANKGKIPWNKSN